MAIIALGLDYRRYRRFTQIAPRVQQVGVSREGGKMVWEYIAGKAPAESVTSADWRFCFDFVIDCALRLQRQ